MKTLILKLNATGDVVRTTTLLHHLAGSITWVTASTNTVLLKGLDRDVHCVAWDDRASVTDDHYDLLINLEDDAAVADFARRVQHRQLFGAYMTPDGGMAYTGMRSGGST